MILFQLPNWPFHLHLEVIDLFIFFIRLLYFVKERLEIIPEHHFLLLFLIHLTKSNFFLNWRLNGLFLFKRHFLLYFLVIGIVVFLIFQNYFLSLLCNRTGCLGRLTNGTISFLFFWQLNLLFHMDSTHY
jgi:hypothetical protein